MSVIVVNAGFAGALASKLTGYAAVLTMTVATAIILCLTLVAEGWFNERSPRCSRVSPRSSLPACR